MTSSRLLLILLLLGGCCSGLDKLQVVHKWQTIEYAWPQTPRNASRETMIHLGHFIPGNPILFDVDFGGGRVFVTTPRTHPGIPAVLSTVAPQGDELNPLLHPYPNWSWHRPGECNGITSTFRVKADECGYLWVPDMGTINHFGTSQKVCPAQLLVFHLATDVLVKRHRFPPKVVRPESLLGQIVVDASARCKSAFAYIADVTTYALVVYDGKRNRSWRIEANSFHSIPHFGHFDIFGSEFDIMDGLFGLSLSPDKRTLYYHALASNTESYVPTAILKNETLFAKGTGVATMKEFKTYPLTRVAQATGEAMSKAGVMFFSEITRGSLNCWNSAREYGGGNIVEVDKDVNLFQHATAFKCVDRANGTEELWVSVNRLQKILDGTLNRTEVNFSVLKAPVKDLISGTLCDV